MYISSDTNIWFDFESINRINYPFLLTHDYYISDITYHDEMNKSDTLKSIVKTKQLKITSVPQKEIAKAQEISQKYPRLSFYDCIALSIAKSRGWILLTGDKALRNAASMESVEYHGTLWIMEQLIDSSKVEKEEISDALNLLLNSDIHGRRLPKEEIERLILKAKENL